VACETIQAFDSPGEPGLTAYCELGAGGLQRAIVIVACEEDRAAERQLKIQLWELLSSARAAL
jgi:hypothetical protein